MSAFSQSGSKSNKGSSAVGLLDDSGNINTARLSQELTAALDFDIKYKQVDNMKKRAVRSAGSYDEFRQLVAAAHLKKVSRREVESLSEVKRGWVKSGNMKSSPENGMLDLQKNENAAFSSSKTAGSKKKSKLAPKSAIAPRTSMELDRNLRRFATEEERWQYVLSLETSLVFQLMQQASDLDLLENLWRLVVEYESRTEVCLQWLNHLSCMSSFSMLLCIAEQETVTCTLTMLQSLLAKADAEATAPTREVADGIDGQQVALVQALLSKFQPASINPNNSSSNINRNQKEEVDGESSAELEDDDNDEDSEAKDDEDC